MKIKDLVEAFRITDEEAKDIISLLNGKVNPEDHPLYPEVTKGFYNPPDRGYAILLIANKICGTYGVEYVAKPGESYHDSEGVDYLNVGDTYVTTLGYNHSTSEFELGCLGDWYEELKEEGFEDEWNSWINSEFEHQLARHFKLDGLYLENDDDKDWFLELFNYACSKVQNDDTWWTESDGKSIYVNWQPILSSLSLNDLDRRFISYTMEEE